MSKVAVVFWSATGNTETMANAVADGAKAKGAEVSLINASDFSAANVGEYDAIAFGCPAMGAEQLEEGDVEPFFAELESKLNGKKVALFGSYGWGSGEWMDEWVNRVQTAGGSVVNGAGVIANNAPDDAALAECEALGQALANA